MCIIVSKSIGVEPPTKRTLLNCFNNNADGAGFMVAYNNEVIINKGFMSFDDFWNAYNEFLTTLKVNAKEVAIIYHFRITTQGGIKQSLTHPYPITSSYDEMRLLRSKCKIALAHNGIISTYAERLNWNAKTKSYAEVEYNDTMTFVKKCVNVVLRGDNELLKDKDTCELLGEVAKSKLALLDYTGHITLIGHFIENNGVFYSNATYQEQKLFANYYWNYHFDNTSGSKKSKKKAKNNENCGFRTTADIIKDAENEVNLLDERYYTDDDLPF